MTTNRRLTPPGANRRRSAFRPLIAGLALATAGALGACAGSSGPGDMPTPANCAGTIELLVENETPLRVRVLELSRAGDSRLLGEMSGRGTRTFTIRDQAGMTYAVVADETGELLASEQGHPRGYQSNGARISRACVDRL